MKRQEAIAILDLSKLTAVSGRKYDEAVDMAIEALQTIDNCDQCEWCCPSDGIPTIHVVRCKDCISYWQHDGIAECTFCGNRKVTPLNGYCHNAERKGGDPE